MSTLAFVPARGGSRGIPGKNIRPFCGRPLIWWTLSALERANGIDEIIVSTDDDSIASTVLGFGLDKIRIHRRAESTATDTASTESAMLEFLDVANTADEIADDDLFVLVQATSPLTRPEDIDHALEHLAASGADSLVTCARSRRFFWTEQGTPINYDPQQRPRRQDFGGCLMENGAFYVQSVGRVRQFQNRLSGAVLPFEMPEYTALELDTEDDWVAGEALMRRHGIGGSGSHRPIRMVLTDVDGVLTDGGMYYDVGGDAMKRFNTLDGKAFERLRQAGIITGIITGEDTAMVARRGAKIRADHVRQGIADKLPVVRELCAEHGIELDEVAYIGDDLNDLEVLRAVGLSACPSSAVRAIRHEAEYVCTTAGGAGCVREFVDDVVLPRCARTPTLVRTPQTDTPEPTAV